MMNLKAYLSCCLLLLLAACNDKLDLDDVRSDERLVLYCMPCAGLDTTLIQLSRSVPVHKRRAEPEPLQGVRIVFSVNGEEQPVLRSEKGTPTVPAGCYYVVGQWHEGDAIDLTAEAEDLPPIQAHTVIPSAFPLKEVDLAVKPGVDDRMVQFRITFADPDGTDDCYGVHVLHKSEYKRELFDEHGTLIASEVEESYITPFYLEADDEPLMESSTGLNSVFELYDDYYQNLYIWDDRLVQGKTYTLRMNGYYSADGVWEEEGERRSQLHTYKLRLYTLSPEMYRYLKSLNDNANNELGHVGLAPLRNLYTNVEGGFGVLGGCRIVETGWLDNPS